MNNLKVSLVCTIRDENSSVREFLDSLISQSRQPDEIIIVDGGSTDGTVNIIRSYIEKGAPIKLIVKNGANIAQGRNIAIETAKFDIIASTDAGCRIDRDWLQNLVRPFKEYPSLDVVSGAYISFGETIFEKCVAELTGGNIDSWTSENFLPSSRSVAFKKDAWKRVNGYPESLDYAEDTVFDLNLKKNGCRFKIAKDAMIYWQMRKNLRSLFRQYYNYSKWNAIADICKSKLIEIYSFLAIFFVFVAYYKIFYAILLIIIFLVYYFVRYGIILFIKLRKIACLYYGPPIALTLLLSNILGIVVGKVKK